MAEFFALPHTWVGVGVCIFFGILIWKKVPHTVLGMLDSRAAAISKELNDARQLREEAAALLAQYKQKQAEAEKEASAILDEAHAEAKRYATEARAALEIQIERRAKVAEERIAQAEAQAIAEMRVLAADTAVKAAESLIAERMSDKLSGELIQSALKEIPNKLN
nr:MAG: ATP F0F1 synthase subunit B [Hyphomicrobiales bacterium]